VTADRDERLAHAKDALAILFAGSQVATATSRRPDSDVARSFAVVPSARHPRLLVPLAPRRAAAAALRAYGGRLKLADRVAYRAVGLALQTAGSGVLTARLTATADASATGIDIDTHLSEVLGTTVAVAVHLTPARANRKPILQALSANSRYPVGFAKVATNALTTDLVIREAAALRTIASASAGRLVVPELVSDSCVNGLQTLVTRPLPTWSSGRLPRPDELLRAGDDVARLAATGTTTVRESAFWLRLRSDLDQIADVARRDDVRRVADHLEVAAGNAEIEIGAGHGDWSPWNMWQTPRGLLVWDWERFATDVPLGSDLVHYRLQELLVIKRARPLDAARAALDAAPQRLIGVLHLLALAVRFDKDDQAGAGNAVRPNDEWLLPVIDNALRDRGLLVGRTA
jgi:hypothetical protein